MIFIEATIWHKPGPNQNGSGFLGTAILDTVQNWIHDNTSQHTSSESRSIPMSKASFTPNSSTAPLLPAYSQQSQIICLLRASMPEWWCQAC
jgi:hypothetical protein